MTLIGDGGLGHRTRGGRGPRSNQRKPQPGRLWRRGCRVSSVCLTWGRTGQNPRIWLLGQPSPRLSCVTSSMDSGQAVLGSNPTLPQSHGAHGSVPQFPRLHGGSGSEGQ